MVTDVQLSKEMDSLSPPCRLEFNCKLFTGYAVHGVAFSRPSGIRDGDGGAGKRAKLDNHEATSASKKKGKGKVKVHRASWESKPSTKKGGKDAESAGDTSADRQLILEFELISGDNKDILHQVVQYFKNKSHKLKF